VTEKVLAAVPVQKGRAFRLPQSYALVVTERRTILVPLDRAAITQAGKDAVSQARAAGKGFFGRWGAQIQAIVGYTQRYAAMDPETILHEHPGSQVLDNASVRSAKLTQGEDEDGNKTSCKLTIRTPQERVKVELQAPPEGLVDALRTAYGRRFKG